jgi:hypothetical protein
LEWEIGPEFTDGHDYILNWALSTSLTNQHPEYGILPRSIEDCNEGIDAQTREGDATILFSVGVHWVTSSDTLTVP